MKHIFSEDMGEKLPCILMLLEGVTHARSGLHYLEAALLYVASGSSYVNDKDILRALKEALDDEEGDIMATLAERWIEEGIQTGMVRDARGRHLGERVLCQHGWKK